ncbi:MAG: NAD(P)H-dependent oxidoreductase subunit E [Acidimicrobiia bacterium]|nr:NAD(P)H-dependent oxidoreductase subunit E [Acidimicrobiia bacterium]
MESRSSLDAPTPAEVRVLDAAVGLRHDTVDARVIRRGPDRRHLLLPALHALQDGVGWISPEALGELCARLEVPRAEAFGVATFYALLRTEAGPATVVHACDDIACRVHPDYRDPAAAHAAHAAGESVGVHPSPCLGQCDRAPALFVQRSGAEAARWRAVGSVADALATAGTEPASPRVLAAGPAWLTGRIGVVDPASLEDYRAHGGYGALRTALAVGPDAVLREIADSGLRGRGGAAFPTGVKWRAVAASARRERYVVCNADESEPGTFKDRVLMEGDPYALVESMTIAAAAVGATRGYVYIRGEYPEAEERVAHAIDRARHRGLLGSDVAGSGLDFDIEVRRGAGAYICGEETALFNSLEGYRGEPRSKPPFPTEAGLFGRPTVVNNVETLHNVTVILNAGAEAFRRVGTAESPGTKLFSIAGSVANPGVYEVPFGTRLDELLALAGAPGAGGAVLLGGAAGMFVSPDATDLPLTFEDSRMAGLTLGSGSVTVFDRSVDIGDIVERITSFFRDESCGQCVPCRVGTVRQHETIVRLRNGSALPDDGELLEDLAGVMGDASICGLGHTAASAVTSALRLGLIAGAPASSGNGTGR